MEETLGGIARGTSEELPREILVDTQRRTTD